MSLRILLADDQIATRHIVRFNLEQFGFEVLDASDGQQAWDILQKEPIHLLVTDESMPRVGGLDLCRQIRQAPHLTELSIILISGMVPAPSRKLLDSLSVSHFFAKPFSPREMVDRICEILWSRQSAVSELAEPDSTLITHGAKRAYDSASA